MSSPHMLTDQVKDLVDALNVAHEREKQKLIDELDKLEDASDLASQKDREEIERLEDALKKAQEIVWGTCKRGCPPAYLNHAGFCSPACAMGAPRGEFVTVKETSAA